MESNNTRKLTISGLIYQLYPRNVILNTSINDHLVGSPIRDRNGDQIGIITSINSEAGTWQGYIHVDMDTFYEFVFDRLRSISMEVDE